jgi:hypothetical protein
MTCDAALPAVPTPPGPCRHCGRARVNRPRGLCWTCYYAPGVASLYPSISLYAGRGVRIGSAPATPTTAAPGSEEKLEELCRRILAGQSPWCEADAI